MPMSVTSAQRRPITSDRHSLRAEPGFHVVAYLGEPRRGAGLEPQHQHGLGIRGANQSPAVAEQHPHSIDVDDLVRRSEERRVGKEGGARWASERYRSKMLVE